MALNVIIFIIRMRIAGNVLPIFRYQKNIIFTSTIGAIVGATLLWTIPHLVTGAFTTSIRISQSIVWITIGTLSIISLLIHSTQYLKLIKTTTVVATVTFIGQILILYIPGEHQHMIQFFFCIIIIEERIKYAITQHTYSRRSIEPRDIIIFAIIAGLSYARGENMLIATQIDNSIARIPTYLAHTIITTIFVYGLTPKIISRKAIASITGAILLHLGYNMIGGNIHRLRWMVTIVIRYGALTYVISKSNTIYLLKRETLAKNITYQ